VAFGGTLVQDIPTQRPDALRHRDADVYDQNFHTVDLVPHTRLAELLAGQGINKINSVHHQCVKDLAPGFVVEARCPDDGTVEAIRHGGTPWVAGVQWHPEFHKLEYGTLDDAPILQDFLSAARASRAG
jgi:putative glutamine amidotransferase